MLYNEEAVRANIRNREGKRIFYLGKGDQLTSAARDYLSRERIEIRPGEQAKQDKFPLLTGGFLTEKPEHMTHLNGDFLVVKDHPRICLLYTSSGSGSEVTDFAILTHNKVKHPLVDKRLRPDAAILDSDLLQELPKGLIAETGFDALSHAVEAYAAKNAGTMTDLYAREAFSSAFAALPASYAGRKDVRLKVHQAATMAGIAFTQAGLGLSLIHI